MAVRPQEELPGLEGSSEVIPSLSLPPGRTAPPPAFPHSQGASPSCGSPGQEGRRPGDRPARLPHLSAGTLVLHQGQFLRFSLDPLCCGPGLLLVLAEIGAAWATALQRMRSLALSPESSQGLSPAPLPHCRSSRPRKVGSGLGQCVSS